MLQKKLKSFKSTDVRWRSHAFHNQAEPGLSLALSHVCWLCSWEDDLQAALYKIYQIENDHVRNMMQTDSHQHQLSG